MKKFLIIAVVFSLLSSVSYAQKEAYTENREIGKFNAISSSTSIDVYITEGSSSTIKVEANRQELLSRIKTEVRGNELKISFDGRGNNFSNTKMKVYVTAKNLTAIKTSSSADIHSIGELNAKDIDLVASSSGDIKLHLNAENITCDASSSGDIELKGKAYSVKVNASSSGDVDMKNLIVKVAEVSASSSADVDIHVTETLKARASSSADIKYWGNPKNVDKHQSSSGTIKAY